MQGQIPNYRPKSRIVSEGTSRKLRRFRISLPVCETEGSCVRGETIEKIASDPLEGSNNRQGSDRYQDNKRHPTTASFPRDSRNSTHPMALAPLPEAPHLPPNYRPAPIQRCSPSLPGCDCKRHDTASIHSCRHFPETKSQAAAPTRQSC